MAITKAALRSAVRQLIDDPNAKRWTDTGLDVLIEGIYDDLYSQILDIAPYLNSQYQQIALPLHSPGYIDLRQTLYGGDLTQRMYRIQQVIADGRQYFPKDPRDYLMTASSNTGDVTTIRADTGVEQRYSYQFLGNQLWLHPLGQVTTFVEMRYSYRTLFTSLTNGYTLDIPEGSTRAFVNSVATEAVLKGGAEETKEFRLARDEARNDLFSAIRRQYHGMTVPFTTENAWSVGGT